MQNAFKKFVVYVIFKSHLYNVVRIILVRALVVASETTFKRNGNVIPGEGDVGGSAKVVPRILARQIRRVASGIRQGVRSSSNQRHKQPVRAGEPVGTEWRVQNCRGLLAQGEFNSNIIAIKKNEIRFRVRKYNNKINSSYIIKDTIRTT